MSYPKGLAEQSFDEPVGTGRTDVSVRPKVMRRPANFSGAQGQPQPTMPTIHLPPAERSAAVEENENLALSAPASLPMVLMPHSKQWQDDIRFGIAMLTILLLVNLALITWLPHLRPAEATAAPTVVTAQDSIRAMPFGLSVDPSSLTVYAKPAHSAAVEEPAAEPDAQSDSSLQGGADSGPNQ